MGGLTFAAAFGEESAQPKKSVWPAGGFTFAFGEARLWPAWPEAEGRTEETVMASNAVAALATLADTDENSDDIFAGCDEDSDDIFAA